MAKYAYYHGPSTAGEIINNAYIEELIKVRKRWALDGGPSLEAWIDSNFDKSSINTLVIAGRIKEYRDEGPFRTGTEAN
jgi:hypothetical protein